MIKAELRKLRALPATQVMINAAAQKIEYDAQYGYGCAVRTKHVVTNKYHRMVRIQQLGAYIKIAVFYPKLLQKGIRTPTYEIYLNTEGKEYITRELDEKGNETRWLTAMAVNLGEDFSDYTRRQRIYINPDGKRTLQNLLILKPDAGQKGWERLIVWQRRIKEEQIKLREEREVRPWDEDMQLVPNLPKSFPKWMQRHAADEVYIIYDYGSKEGWCTKCQRMVPVKSPRHNADAICPHCKADAVYKASGKCKTLATKEYYAEIIQKMPGGIVVRSFYQTQNFRGDYKKPRVFTHEYKRILIWNDGTTRKYEYDMYKNKYRRWIRDKNYFAGKSETLYWSTRSKLYKRNWSYLKNETFLKCSTIDLWDVLPCGVVKYIVIERGNPLVEKLVRIGMFRMARDVIRMDYDRKLIDQKQTELAKLLKIDGSRLKRLKAMDGNIAMLRWMQYEKLANTIWPDDMIKDFGEAGFSTSAFNFLPTPLSFVKCWNYIKKQMLISRGTLGQILTTWRDYINMADQLKMNTKLDQIARPKDLKAAHDECVLLREKGDAKKEAQKLAKKWPKVNKQLPKLKKFEYTADGYTIVAPESIEDIVMEGRILKHCVHTCDYYFSRIQTDESYLFFLRKAKSPDVPWYTLEVEPSGNIRQKRTTGDNQNKDFVAAVDFLKKWQKYFAKQLTKEEKKLGEKSNKLRIDNYKNLRKNGNKVWHGRLAGQLLADVLEADFMEVM